MPKQNTKKPPPAREPIVTGSHTQASSSIKQKMKDSDTIHVTPVIEQRNSRGKFIFVSPTRGEIIVEQLLKFNYDTIVRI